MWHLVVGDMRGIHQGGLQLTFHLFFLRILALQEGVFAVKWNVLENGRSTQWESTERGVAFYGIGQQRHCFKYIN